MNLQTVHRHRLVAVIGSGMLHDHSELAEAVGRLVADMGFHLLTGGGLGVMQLNAFACRTVTRNSPESGGVTDPQRPPNRRVSW